MLELRIPIRSEELLEDIDESFCEDLLGLVALHVKRIEAEWKLLIRRIEDDDIVASRFRDIHERLFKEVSMRIDDPETPPLHNVINEETRHELRFSDSGLSDDIRMPKTILIEDSDRHFHRPEI